MNKKLAHTILFVGIFLCMEAFWAGFRSFSHTLTEIRSQPDSINFGSRSGFFIVAIGYLFIYSVIILEHFWPSLIKKYRQFLSYAIAAMVIILLAGGFIGSSWLKSKVENAGYVYCRNASGISALSKTLVYTINMDICNELVDTKLKEKRERK